MRLAMHIVRLMVIVTILVGLPVWPYTEQTLASEATRPIILIVNASAANQYGSYLGEILQAEGLNSFDTLQIAALTSATLSQYRLAILAETPLTSGQANLFTNYVSGGGRLIAMRPDPQIASLFGITQTGTTQTDGYLAIDMSLQSGEGLPSDTLQIHGPSTHYTLTGATAIAQLYSNATTATIYPAIVTATSGSGKTAAFAYDLATNVVLTRQGNPANANVDSDGDGVLRTVDLFQSAVPGAAPWVNRDKIALPQADIQQRLFARQIETLLDIPMPRLWYFPNQAMTMMILTADAHANPLSYYQNEITSLTAHEGRATFYLTIGSSPNDVNLQDWRAQGYTFGIHPYHSAPNPSYPPFNITNLSQGYQVYSDWYDQAFTSPPSRTVRNHQVAWLGWTDAAELAVSHGMRLDANFYHWGSWLRKPDGSWPHGYITGSGQPMKFITSDGTILPYYQQLTQLVDEQLHAGSGQLFEQLNDAQAITVSQQLIESSLNGDYAAIMTQFHVDHYSAVRSWAEGTLDYAHHKGVPIWNADEWLAFIEARYATTYDNIVWNEATKTLMFDMTSQSSNQNLTTILPLYHTTHQLSSVVIDGVPQTYSIQRINGVDAAFVSSQAGNHTFRVNYLPTTIHLPLVRN